MSQTANRIRERYGFELITREQLARYLGFGVISEGEHLDILGEGEECQDGGRQVSE